MAQRIEGENLGRRTKGSGSIYTRKDGTVVGQYEVDTPDGKKRRYIRGKNKKDVALRLASASSERVVCDEL